MGSFDSGRRLCLLVEAGEARYAIDAASVVEVSPPDSSGKSIRGLLDLVDLTRLLGGGDEQRPGMAIVLDVSPTLAVRVKRVLEVADVARDPQFKLPRGLGDGLTRVVRGAILRDGRLHLELMVDALARPLLAEPGTPSRPFAVVEQAPERALLFESQGQLFGLPLAFVSQVVNADQTFCALPGAGGAITGIVPHVQSLWPVFSAPALIGQRAALEPLLVFAELAGQNVGLFAARVLGVQEGFTPAEGPGKFACRAIPQPALFLDWQRMFF